MSKPTKPGFYWYKPRDEWEVVKVSGDGWVYFYDDRTQNYVDALYGEWGGEITRE